MCMWVCVCVYVKVCVEGNRPFDVSCDQFELNKLREGGV